MTKYFYFICACLSLGIGLIGILLPLIPTTPLLLLSGFCFANSSERFENWLRNSKIYQFYVADYTETKTIDRQRKKKIIIQIYILMTISIFLAPIWLVKIALIGLTLFITYYLFYIIPDKE